MDTNLASAALAGAGQVITLTLVILAIFSLVAALVINRN